MIKYSENIEKYGFFSIKDLTIDYANAYNVIRNKGNLENESKITCGGTKRDNLKAKYEYKDGKELRKRELKKFNPRNRR